MAVVGREEPVGGAHPKKNKSLSLAACGLWFGAAIGLI